MKKLRKNLHEFGQRIPRPITVIILILVPLVLSLVLEAFAFNYIALTNNQDIDVKLSPRTATEEEATYFAKRSPEYAKNLDAEGVKKEFDVYDITGNGKFIDKLFLVPTEKVKDKYAIYYTFKNAYGVEETKWGFDNVHPNVETAVTELDVNLVSAKLYMPKTTSISSMSLKTQFQLNFYRIFIMILLFGIIELLIFGREIFRKHPAAIFAAVCILIGSLEAFAQPWYTNLDDETHFNNAYQYSFFGKAIENTAASFQCGTSYSINYDTIEEQNQINEYWDSLAATIQTIDPRERFVPFTKRCYMPVSAAFAVSRAMHLPFTGMLHMGRIFSLLFYTLAGYLAVRFAKRGKGLIAAFYILPNCLLNATSFNYDAITIAWFGLAFVLIANEFMEPDKKLSIKSAGGIIGSVVIGSTAKAVWAPFLASMFFCNNKKLGGKKKAWILRILILAICASLVAVLLVVTDMAHSLGDTRGGAVNQKGQFLLILAQPFVYLGLLLKDIFIPFTSLCYSGFTMQGYNPSIGSGVATLMLFALGFGVITAGNGAKANAMKGRYKFNLLAMGAISAVIVASSMYLRYTVYGATYFSGVQTRYWIPLFLPILLAFDSDRFHIDIKPETAFKVTFGAVAILQLVNLWQTFLVPYCL